MRTGTGAYPLRGHNNVQGASHHGAMPNLLPGYQSVTDPESNNRRALSSSFSGNKLLLYLGRMHPKKGLSNLLRAWAKLRGSEDWVLAVAGWDQAGHEAELKRLASELEIYWADKRSQPHCPASVLFLGPQFATAKKALLARCDAFILPSFSEGVPMAVLEAWSYAKPVLMTPQCNLPEGFAAHAAIEIESEPDAIADGLKELFRANTSTLGEIGSRGRALVASHFAWPKIAADLKKVYYWMVGGGSKPDCILTS
jgi:poly(glycerol-phosphate) alpha-glucosyltransferase